MLRRILLTILALAGFATPAAAKSDAPSRAADSLLVSAVSIVDTAKGTISPPRDILVVDGKIAEIAEAGTIARDKALKVVEASGAFALPGLIDVHAHLGDGGAGSQSEKDREQALGQFLRYGVTTIFVPGGSGANDDAFATWRRRCSAGEIACPGLYGSGSIITAVGSHPVTTIFGLPADADANVLHEIGVTTIRPGDDVRGLIASKVARGADAIKIVIEDGPPPWYPKPHLTDAQVAALVAAAHDLNVPVHAHVSRADHVAAGLAGGIDAIMHSPLDPLSDALLEKMAQDDVFYVATLALYDGIRQWTSGQEEADPFALAGITPRSLATLRDPGFLAAAPESVAQAQGYLDVAADNLRRASAAGVPMALGTDTNNPFVYPGHSAHEELTLMVGFGLTPHQALRAATVGGATFLGKMDTLGRIAEGYEADMLIVDRDPLKDILNARAIRQVVSDGRIVENVVSAALYRAAGASE